MASARANRDLVCQRRRIGSGIVARPRLFDRLDTSREHSLTLVWAPAGFGKTTLLAAWARRRPEPVVWLALDERDGSLDAIVDTLVAAVRSVIPGACDAVRTLLQGRQGLSAAHIAAVLSNDLDDLPHDLIPIVDDYHRVSDPGVRSLIEMLVLRPPARLHLILASRVEPSLPLARLRGAGQIVEIGADQLRFTDDEARALLAATLMEVPDHRLVARLHRQFDGWPAGLRQAADLLRCSTDPSAIIDADDADPRIAEASFSEMFSRQDPFVQELLLTSAIVDRFNPSLCQVLLGLSGHDLTVRRALRQIECGDLFVIALDGEHAWYQHHHPFRQLLMRRLESTVPGGRIAALHARAGRWFAEQGKISSAMKHLLAAGDEDGAARVLEQSVHRSLDREELAQLGRRLDRVPASLLRRRPALLVARAWLLMARKRCADIPPYLDAADALLSEGFATVDPSARRMLRAEIDGLRGIASLAAGDRTSALMSFIRTVGRVKPEQGFAHSAIEACYAMTLGLFGRHAFAERRLLRALNGEAAQDPARAPRLLFALAHNHATGGNLHQLELTARQLLRVADLHQLPSTLSWAHLLLGRVAFEWNDLDVAVGHLEAVVHLRDRADPRALRAGAVMLALAYQALGQPERAEALVDAYLGCATDGLNIDDVAVMSSVRARLALSQRDVEAAVSHLHGVDVHSLPPAPAYEVEVPSLSDVRVLLARGDQACLGQAARRLDRLLGVYRTWHATMHLVGIFALRAIVAHRLGEHERARVALRHALVLAQPGGMIRTFTDHGPWLAPVLRDLIEHLGGQTDLASYAGRLLVELPDLPFEGEPRPEVSTPDLTLDEALSRREIEVLVLLDRRLSNNEIAEELHLSPLTVKRHTINLYHKLDVNGRRQAVARARTLGLLVPA